MSEGEGSAPEVHAANESQQRLKVVFELEVDDEGWPPTGAKRMWALRVSDDTARLKNVPFFARGYVVRFDVDNDGVRWMREAVEFSGVGTVHATT